LSIKLLSQLVQLSYSISIPFNIHLPTFLIIFIFSLFVFIVYGRYIGYIFQDQSSFFGLLGLSVIAGAFCGIATALSGNVLKMYETPTITGNTTLVSTSNLRAISISL
jgi:hypothetical protein